MRRIPWQPPVRPLPVLLALGAVSSVVAALRPSARSARCVARGVVLGAVAVYSWMIL